MKEIGVYIHIPFCIKKCDYCDFISYCNKQDLVEEYIEKSLDNLIKQITGRVRSREIILNMQVIFLKISIKILLFNSIYAL